MKLFNLIFLITSFVLLAFAPDQYNKSYCVIIFIVALISCLKNIHYSCKKNGVMNFDTFFLPSFILMSFFHSAFIYPDDKLFFSFAYPYDYSIISKAVATALVGMQCYLFGRTCPIKHDKRLYLEKRYFINSWFNFFVKYAAILTVGILFIYVFLIANFTESINHIYARLLILIQAIIAVYIIQQNFNKKNFNKPISLINNKTEIALLLLFSVSVLYTGGRGGIIILSIFLFSVYRSTFYNISLGNKILFISLFLAAFAFFGLYTLIRVSPVNLHTASILDCLIFGVDYLKESPNAIFLLLTDFIVVNRNLYVGVAYPMSNSYLFGASYFSYIFVFLPFGATFFTNLFLGGLPNEFNTGSIITDLAGSTAGLGTNIIGDLYMNFGFIGVCVIMFLLGKLVIFSERNNSIYAQILQHSLVAFSFYIPRASILCWLDFYAMVLLIFILGKVCFGRSAYFKQLHTGN